MCSECAAAEVPCAPCLSIPVYPCCAQVLSLKSRVLRGLFSDLLGSRQLAGRGDGGGGDGGSQDSDAIDGLPLIARKRKAALVEASERLFAGLPFCPAPAACFRDCCSSAPGLSDCLQGLVIEAPFRDCSLFDACRLLRFCCHLEVRALANLAAVLGSLPSLLRLAHRPDAPRIQQAVCERMAGKAPGQQARPAAMDTSLLPAAPIACCSLCRADKLPSAAWHELLEWVAAADRCQLDELRARCMRELAHRLAGQPSELAGTLADAALVVQRCGASVLAPWWACWRRPLEMSRPAAAVHPSSLHPCGPPLPPLVPCTALLPSTRLLGLICCSAAHALMAWRGQAWWVARNEQAGARALPVSAGYDEAFWSTACLRRRPTLCAPDVAGGPGRRQAVSHPRRPASRLTCQHTNFLHSLDTKEVVLGAGEAVS